MRKFFLALIIVMAAAFGGYYYFYGAEGLLGNNIFVKGTMFVTSPNFENNGSIPRKFTCDGTNTNPTIDLDRVPADAKSLVLIMIDVDSLSKDFTHWLVYNISPETTRIDESALPSGAQVAYNDFGRRQYDGPCPPLGSHKYIFKVYAIDTILSPDLKLEKTTIDKLLKGHIIAKGQISGAYIKN